MRLKDKVEYPCGLKFEFEAETFSIFGFLFSHLERRQDNSYDLCPMHKEKCVARKE